MAAEKCAAMTRRGYKCHYNVTDYVGADVAAVGLCNIHRSTLATYGYLRLWNASLPRQYIVRSRAGYKLSNRPGSDPQGD